SAPAIRTPKTCSVNGTFVSIGSGRLNCAHAVEGRQTARSASSLASSQMIVLREAGKDSFEDNPDKGIFEMDLHRMELPTPFPVGPVNAYLLRGDPLTLVDTGPKTVEAQTALERGV